MEVLFIAEKRVEAQAAYIAAAGALMIYLLIFLRSTAETTTVMMVFKQNAFQLKVNAIAFVTHVVFAVVMYKRFGWLGVPCATVIMIYAQNTAFLWKSARLLGESLLTVMPWETLALRLLTANRFRHSPVFWTRSSRGRGTPNRNA
jgi:hypothetical protein